MTAVLDHFRYGYDPAGNRLWKENVVAGDLPTPVPLDELYEYDDLYRLVATQRGQLVDGQNGKEITNALFAQDWTLDGLGNFGEFKEDSDTQQPGWETDQDRTVNSANEIQTITGNWITPQYDRAGNMISGPRADAPDTAQFYVYDAWNRLANVFADTDENGEFDDEEDELVAEYRYDGRNRRIEKVLTEAAGEPGSVEYFHNHAWQVLEERFFDDEQELERVCQNVWSPRYIDSLILRDECSPTTGAILLPNRLFYIADANYNVTALVQESPTTPDEWQVVERYAYDPYGRATVLDGDFAPNPQSLIANPHRYTGRTLDFETGNMDYRRRIYQLALSQFCQRDPLGYAAGDVNLYRYVGSRPIQYVDPDGRQVVILCDTLKRIEPNLRLLGIKGFSQEPTGRAGQVLLGGARIDFPKDGGIGEIAGAMIRSARLFRIAGFDAQEQFDNWELHVEARMGVVRSAQSARFRFSSDTPVLPAFGVSTVGRNLWAVWAKNQNALFDAYDDAWRRPDEYHMGCQLAAQFVMMHGTLLALKNAGKPQPERLTIKDSVDDWTDWVPGDWGHIQNRIKNPPVGYEGENIIYLGGGKWWGLAGTHQEPSLYEDEDGWGYIVNIWGYGALQPHREYPGVGLE